MRITWLLGNVIPITLMSSLISGSTTGAPAAQPQSLVEGNTAFALDLYGQLKTAQGNLFFSPYSISTALAMTWTGAAGETTKEMSTVLHLPAAPAAACAALQKQLTGAGAQRKFELFVANALWGQKGIPFKPAFLATVKDNFGGGLNDVDFKGATEAARKTINDWVAAQTKDKIKDLLAPGVLDPATKLVLTNAIYFKAAWQSQFQSRATSKGPFYLDAEKKVDADMMKQTERARYAATDGVKLCELAYEGGQVSMLVILPDKRDGLAEVEKSLTAAKLEAWTKALAGLMMMFIKTCWI